MQEPTDPGRRTRALLDQASWLAELAARLVPDRQTADDLVQETWVAALRRPAAQGRPPRAWLATVLRNLLHRRRRSAGRRAEREALAAGPRAELEPARVLERLESQALLADVLRELPEELRDTLVLRYYEGLSSARIGRLRGVPESTVRWRLQRGLVLLREKLDARHGGERGAWCLALLPLAVLARPGWLAAGAAATTSAAASPTALKTGVIAMKSGTKVLVAASCAALCGLWILGPGRGAVAERSSAAAAVRPAAAEVAEDTGRAPGTDASARTELAPPAAAPAVEAAPRVATAPNAAPLLPARVEARFLDGDGLAVPGVELSWRRPTPVGETLHAVDDASARVSARSGGDGRVRLSVPCAPGPADATELLAERAGYASVVLRTVLEAGASKHLGDVVLGPGGGLRGRLVDVRGRALRGRVHALRAAFDAADLASGALARLGPRQLETAPFVDTREDGSFFFPDLAPGTLRLVGKAPETRFGWTEPFELEAGVDRHGVDVVVEPWRREDRLRGRVLDHEGRAYGDVTLIGMYQAEQSGGSFSVPVDDAGRFDVVIPTEGAYHFQAFDRSGRYPPALSAEVRPGDDAVEVRFEQAVQVALRVVDDRGEPVARYGYEVEQGDDTHDVRVGVGEHEEGRVAVDVLPEPFSVVVSAPGYDEARVGPFDPTLPDGVPAEIRVRVETAPRIHGRVVAKAGPVEGATVEVLEAVDGRNVRSHGFLCRMQPESQAPGRSGDDGGFVVDLPAADRFFLRVTHAGYADLLLGPLSAGDARVASEDGLLLELSAGGALAGRVLVDEGTGEGTIVAVHFGDGRPRTQRAGPDGRFRFDGLPAGACRVERVDDEVVPGARTLSFGGFAETPAFELIVRAGAVTAHDLDLRSGQ